MHLYNVGYIVAVMDQLRISSPNPKHSNKVFHRTIEGLRTSPEKMQLNSQRANGVLNRDILIRGVFHAMQLLFFALRISAGPAIPR